MDNKIVPRKELDQHTELFMSKLPDPNTYDHPACIMSTPNGNILFHKKRIMFFYVWEAQ